MFCKDCGGQLAGDARFCPHCGSAQPETSPVESAGHNAEPCFADKVRTTAKNVVSSTGFLIATICLTFAQLSGLFAFDTAGSVFAMCRSILPEFSVIDANSLSRLECLSRVMDIIGIIPGILITLGLWITFCSCASRKNKVNTSGLTMIFAVNLVQLVLTCLALLAASIPLTAICANTAFLASEDVIETILLAVGLALLAVFVFALIYYIKLCTTLSNVRSTLKTGAPNRKVSRLVAILCFISGGICILRGISSLLSAGFVSLDGYYDGAFSHSISSEFFFSAASALLTAVAQIIFGALIFTYRRRMKALEAEDRILAFQTLSYAEPYTSPVYIPPEPATEPAVITEPATEEKLDETKRWDL